MAGACATWPRRHAALRRLYGFSVGVGTHGKGGGAKGSSKGGRGRQLEALLWCSCWCCQCAMKAQRPPKPQMYEHAVHVCREKIGAGLRRRHITPLHDVLYGHCARNHPAASEMERSLPAVGAHCTRLRVRCAACPPVCTRCSLSRDARKSLKGSSRLFLERPQRVQRESELTLVLLYV